MGKIRRDRDDPDLLRRYREKRSASRTNEPFGEQGALRGAPRQFVVQKHAARRVHYDLRLEIDGVLRSWAVPQGPSLDPSVKRLAVLTEDHPLDYVEFEGVIPSGNYGAGAMIVWDRGTWVALEPIHEGFAKGKLLFELHGYKLRGVWTLVRTKRGDSGKEWLLIKKPDGASTQADATVLGEQSILSGVTVEELAEGSKRARELARVVQALPLPSVSALQRFAPMLAEVGDAPFDDPRWVFELKYDGYRLAAQREGERSMLRYRSGKDATALFPDICAALTRLPNDAFVLDGEVVVLDDDGRPNFQRLQQRAQLSQPRDIRRAALEHPATLYVFDALVLEGKDLRTLVLHERKALVTRVLGGHGIIRYADHVVGHGKALFAQILELGLEGIMAKRGDRAYVEGRSDTWLKIRVQRSADLVIIGFTAPEGARLGFGAVHVAWWDAGQLRYAGRVGTGFTDAQLVAFRRRFDKLARPSIALDAVPEDPGRATWLEPRLVCEVRYRAITDQGLLRHASFVRMRDDKSGEDCVAPPLPPAVATRPAAHPSERLPHVRSELMHEGTASANSTRSSETETNAADEVLGQSDAGPEPALAREEPTAVVISNPNKVFWPSDGYTKRDLVDYYERMGEWILPYLRDRPLVLTRYPDGIEGKSFFQKNAPPYARSRVRTETMWSEHAEREIDYFVCDSLDSLLYVINMGAIPLHVWSSRIRALQHPDFSIVDLDPKGAPFEHVVRLALAIRRLAEDIGLPTYIKTSGATGLHVLIPLGGRCTFEQSRQLAHIISQVIVSEHADIATVARPLSERHGRVYLDYVQNGHGRLLVAPFSVRPLPAAPVSTPLRWSEVGKALRPGKHTIASVPRRMQRLKSDPLQPMLSDRPDLARALERLAARLERASES